MVVSDDGNGCHPCGCSLSTAVSLLCNNVSGQCPCKSGLIGRICDVIEDFYWLPYSEGVIYEAEFASLSVSYRLSVMLVVNLDVLVVTGRSYG